MGDVVSIVIADDDDALRLLVRIMIGQEPGFAVIGDVASGDEALELLGKCHPDVLIVDFDMPGADTLTTICERFPATRVVVWSGFDQHTVREHLPHLHCEVVTKGSPSRLLDQLRTPRTYA